MLLRAGVIIALLLICGQQGRVVASDPIVKVAGTIIPYILDMDKPGPYNKAYDMLVDGFVPIPELHMVPIRRANLLFFSGKMDCLYISSDEMDFFVGGGLTPSDVVISHPINHIYVKIYTRSEDPVVTSASQMEGQVAAVDITVGEPDAVNAKFFDKKALLLPAQTVGQALAMLEQGRVDAAIVYDIDVAIWKVNHSRNVSFQTYEKLTLESEVDTFACRRTTGTEAFIEHINGQLEALKGNGALEAMFQSAVKRRHNKQ